VKPIKVALTTQQKDDLLKKFHEDAQKELASLPSPLKLDLPPEEGALYKPDKIEAKEESSESGEKFLLNVTQPEPIFRRFCDLNIPLDTTFEIRLSFDDFDFLLEGFDPKMPAIAEVEEGSEEIKLVSPEVETWNELFAKFTIPFPCKMVKKAEAEKDAVFTGGCATSKIPVTRSTRAYNPPKETVSVDASTRKKVYKPIPRAAEKPVQQNKQVSCTDVCKPTTNGGTESRGWKDSTSHRVSNSNGKIQEQATLYSTLRFSQSIAGKKINEFTLSCVNGMEVEPTTISVYKNQDGKIKAAINNEEMPVDLRPCATTSSRAIQLVGDQEVGSAIDLSMQLTSDKTETDPRRDSGISVGSSASYCQ